MKKKHECEIKLDRTEAVMLRCVCEVLLQQFVMNDTCLGIKSMLVCDNRSRMGLRRK